jgi:hypothetical protein
MDFTNYYILQELTVKSSKDVRFLARSEERKDWQSNIQDIVTATESSGIKKDLVFPITDPTGNFVMNLIYNKGFTYSVREQSLNWLEHNKLTQDNQPNGFYFDTENKEFIIQKHGNDEVVKNYFDYDELNVFLDDIFHINRICKARRGFAIVSTLYFLDNYTTAEVETLKKNPLSPRWFLATLKGDELRKSGGLFGFLKR